jgi:hypothetical protein
MRKATQTVLPQGSLSHNDCSNEALQRDEAAVAFRIEADSPRLRALRGRQYEWNPWSLVDDFRARTAHTSWPA